MSYSNTLYADPFLGTYLPAQLATSVQANALRHLHLHRLHPRHLLPPPPRHHPHHRLHAGTAKCTPTSRPTATATAAPASTLGLGLASSAKVRRPGTTARQIRRRPVLMSTWRECSGVMSVSFCFYIYIKRLLPIFHFFFRKSSVLKRYGARAPSLNKQTSRKRCLNK